MSLLPVVVWILFYTVRWKVSVSVSFTCCCLDPVYTVTRYTKPWKDLVSVSFSCCCLDPFYTVRHYTKPWKVLVSVSFTCLDPFDSLFGSLVCSCLGPLPVDVCVLLVLFGSITCCLCPFCVAWVHYLLSVSFLCCLGLLRVVCVHFVLFGSITCCCVCRFCVVWVRYLFLFGVMLASFQTLQAFNKLQPEKYNIFVYLLFCGFGPNICTWFVLSC